MADPRLEDLRRRRATGEYQGAIRLATALLDAPGKLTAPDAFEVARIGAGAAMATKQPFLAAEFATQELQWADAVDEPELRKDLTATASFHLGAAKMYVGDAHEAIGWFKRFLELDDPPRSALNSMRWAAWFNLGVVLEQRRNYVAATHHFLQAREIAEAAGNVTQLISALLEAAWVEILGNRAEAAGYHLEEANGLLISHANEQLKTTALCHQALYHWRMGEHARATELCQEVLAPDHPGATKHHRSEAAWITGECSLQLGMAQEAILFAKIARDYATEDNWPYLMNQATDLLRRAQEDGGATA